jgi:predicted phage terminase large subunit-like protein
LGTIKHEDSLLANLLNTNKNPGWQSRKFVAVKSFADNQEFWGQWEEVYRDKDNPNRFEDARKFFEERKDEMLAGTEVLWPEGEDYYQLMEVKLEGEVSFYSEKMNQPIDRSKCLIEFEELRFYDDKDLEDRDLVVVGALDPATGKGRTGQGDYGCIVTLGKCKKSGKVFVLDAWFTKYGVEFQIKSVLNKHGRFNYHQFGVEENAFQVIIKDHLQKLSRLSQIHIPIVGIKYGGKEKKEMRIEWMIPFLKDGTVYFHPTQKMLIEQLINYIPTEGMGALHDDGPDALASALKMTLKKKFRMLFW